MGPQPCPQRLTPGVGSLAQMWAQGAQAWEPAHLMCLCTSVSVCQWVTPQDGYVFLMFLKLLRVM